MVNGIFSPRARASGPDLGCLCLEAELDILVIQGTVVSAEHVSKQTEPLNLKRFISTYDIPVIVGGIIPTRDARRLKEMGVAEVLAEYRENLTGTVKLLFQPAEEVMPGGAKHLIARTLAPSLVRKETRYDLIDRRVDAFDAYVSNEPFAMQRRGVDQRGNAEEAKLALLAKAIEHEIIPRLMLAHRSPHECLTLPELAEETAALALTRSASTPSATCSHGTARRPPSPRRMPPDTALPQA